MWEAIKSLEFYETNVRLQRLRYESEKRRAKELGEYIHPFDPTDPASWYVVMPQISSEDPGQERSGF